MVPRFSEKLDKAQKGEARQISYNPQSDMTGKELFEKYQAAGKSAGPGSREWDYAHLLRTAFRVVATEKLYDALETAEREGKKIEITYPIPIDQGYSEPNGIKLI